MEEEPNAMRKVEVRLWSLDQDVEEVHGVLHVAFQVKGAKLGDEELEIVSEHAVEVRIHPALFQVFDSIWLMRIHSD